MVLPNILQLISTKILSLLKKGQKILANFASVGNTANWENQTTRAEILWLNLQPLLEPTTTLFVNEHLFKCLFTN